MPSDIVTKLIAKVAMLEAKVDGLMTYQKWQMGLLAAILLLAVQSWVSK